MFIYTVFKWFFLEIVEQRRWESHESSEISGKLHLLLFFYFCWIVCSGIVMSITDTAEGWVTLLHCLPAVQGDSWGFFLTSSSSLSHIIVSVLSVESIDRLSLLTTALKWSNISGKPGLHRRRLIGSVCVAFNLFCNLTMESCRLHSVPRSLPLTAPHSARQKVSMRQTARSMSIVPVNFPV